MNSDDRDSTASDRDQTSASHDRTADERDELAALRDARAEARDASAGSLDVDAATDRSAARRDRNSARGDRSHASHDREAAFTDRSLSSKERATLLLDGLTGCYRREAGSLELEREILKAERTERPFTLAFIDVDGLKAVNDAVGHDGGDDLLRAVVACVQGVVRDYDVIVRYGGDEFICGLADVVAAEAVTRFDQANASLKQTEHASMSVGVVERLRGESLASLIGRADAAMYDCRVRARSEGLHEPTSS